MNSQVQAVVQGLAVPAAVSAVLAWLLGRSRRAILRNSTAGVACSAGFFAAFALLHREHLTPTEFWHRLPWLGGLAAVISTGLAAIPRGSLAGSALRRAVELALAVGVATLLVPTWRSLVPTRTLHVAGFATSLFMLIVLLDRLAARGLNRMLLFALAMASFCGAAFLAVELSLTFGALGGALFATLAGCWLVLLLRKQKEFVASALPVYAVILGGLMLAGWLNVNSFPNARPLRISMALIPAAPLVLWLFEFGPLSRLKGIKSTVAQVAAVVLALVAASLPGALASAG